MTAPATPRPDYSTRSAAIRETGRRCGLAEEQIEQAIQNVEQLTAPAMPRPDLAALRAEADRLDTAYTQAIQEAAQKNNWYGVPAYAHAAQQARAALRAAQENQR